MSISGVLEVGLCATAGPPRVPGPALVASLEPLGAQTGFPLLGSAVIAATHSQSRDQQLHQAPGATDVISAA